MKKNCKVGLKHVPNFPPVQCWFVYMYHDTKSMPDTSSLFLDILCKFLAHNPDGWKVMHTVGAHRASAQVDLKFKLTCLFVSVCVCVCVSQSQS